MAIFVILTIGITFVLGVALTLLAALALFKGRARGGGASFKYAGISIEGKNGAVVMLCIGAMFVMSGFGWAATRNEAVEKTREVETTKSVVVKQSEELAEADKDLERMEEANAKISEQVQLLPPDRLEAIKPYLAIKRTWHFDGLLTGSFVPLVGR